jgi:mycoredoxin-dependent peroxiredoxin
LAVEVGHEAPDFTLKSPDNEEVTLSSFRGVKNVVVLFFPLAFSGVCTRQFTDLGRNEERYGPDAVVLGISVDSRFAQGAFARSLGLTSTTLLADFEPKGEVARRYGVYLDKRGHSTRASFVIDKAGIVRHAEVVPTPETPDEDAMLAALATCNL